MKHEVHDESSAPCSTFSPPRRLLVLAVLLPAAIAVTNQLLFESAAKSEVARTWLYPSMVLSTAVLSWCVGRYLQPTWLLWVVFAWCLVLLDALTFAACVSGPLPYHLGFVLVSAESSLLFLWAILSTVGWQWRLPAVLVAVPALILFAGNFSSGWHMRGWHLMMVTVSSVVAVLCGGLRLFRFRLAKPHTLLVDPTMHDSIRFHQFGVKHLLVWATAMAPMLLIVRGLDLVLFARVDAQVIFPAVLAALSIATLNLLAIWAVLGRGYWLMRVLVFLTLSLLVTAGLSQYFKFVSWQNPGRRAGSMLHPLAETDWMAWLWLDAALLAALLLLVRANGYLLVRQRDVRQT